MKLINPLKVVFVICGWLSLSVGIIGIWLPILPTTPFILLAAYCFSRGSLRLHRWLRGNRHFGEIIRDWETHRGLRRSAKIMATVMIVLLFSYTLIFVGVPIYIKILLVVIALFVLTYLWTRPTVRPRSDHKRPSL